MFCTKSTFVHMDQLFAQKTWSIAYPLFSILGLSPLYSVSKCIPSASSFSTKIFVSGHGRENISPLYFWMPELLRVFESKERAEICQCNVIDRFREVTPKGVTHNSQTKDLVSQVRHFSSLQTLGACTQCWQDIVQRTMDGIEPGI